MLKRFVHRLFCVGTLVNLVFGASLAGCQSRVETASVPVSSQGTISVSGAFALYPMMVRWSEEYHRVHPDVTFDVSAGGAGKGLADALGGAVDIGMVSRPIFQEEVEKGAFWVAVAKDAVVVTVNAEHPVLDQLLERGLTRETAEGIWITGKMTSWSQVVDGEGGGAIHVYTRSDACGAAQTWADYLGGYAQEDLQGIAVQFDPGLVEAVSNDRLGIGYNNLNFVYDAGTGYPLQGIQPVPLDLDGNGHIAPHESFYDTKADLIAAIAEGRYPSPPARDLNLVTRGKPDGAVKAFLEWVLTEGQQYLHEVGYVPLSQEQLDQGLAKLD